MTFDEIKDMINSTIVENGQRQITGKSINLALIETLTAIEEYLANYKPDVNGVETVYYEESLTEAHQVANAEVYAKCKAAVAEGASLPVVQVDITSTMELPSTNGMIAIASGILTAFVDPTSENATVTGMAGMVIQTESGIVIVNEDGTVTMQS